MVLLWSLNSFDYFRSFFWFVYLVKQKTTFFECIFFSNYLYLSIRNHNTNTFLFYCFTQICFVLFFFSCILGRKIVHTNTSTLIIISLHSSFIHRSLALEFHNAVYFAFLRIFFSHCKFIKCYFLLILFPFCLILSNFSFTYIHFSFSITKYNKYFYCIQFFT